VPNKSVSEQHALKSIIASVICIAISFCLIIIPLDSLTISLINWILFIPAALYALYHSLAAILKWVSKKQQLRWQFLLMTIPPIVFHLVFIVRCFL
jgi:hypothetical protein